MTARNVNVPETAMKPFIKEAKSHTTVYVFFSFYSRNLELRGKLTDEIV